MSGGCTLTAPIRLHCVDTDTLFIYAVSSEVLKNEMGGACGPYGGRERSVQGAGGETRGEETAGETQA